MLKGYRNNLAMIDPTSVNPKNIFMVKLVSDQLSRRYKILEIHSIQKMCR